MPNPAGVWVIDAKRYKGQVAKKDVGGWLRHDVRLFVGRRDCSKLIDAMPKQLDSVRKALGDGWADVPGAADVVLRRRRVAVVRGAIRAGWRPRDVAEGGSGAARAAGPYPPETVARIAAQLDQRLHPAA